MVDSFVLHLDTFLRLLTGSDPLRGFSTRILRVDLSADVLLWVLIKLLFAADRAEVVGLVLVVTPACGSRLVNSHSTDRISGHDESPPSLKTDVSRARELFAFPLPVGTDADTNESSLTATPTSDISLL
jgi:hypothetical protein